MAEAVFIHLVEEAGLSSQFHIDSVGTISYHVGEPTHSGTRRVLAENGIRSNSISRQVTPIDLAEADYVIVMDRDNLHDLKAMAQRTPLNGRLHLLLEFAAAPPTLEVPDPYYNGSFEKVYQLVESGCRGLLAQIRAEHNI